MGYGCKDNVFIEILQMKISVFSCIVGRFGFYGKNKASCTFCIVQDAGSF